MSIKITALLFAALTGFAATTMAALLDREIAFSEADIQAALVKSVPQERNYRGLIRVVLPAAPTIALGNPPGRVGLAARVDIALLGNRPLPVNFSGTAGIRYDDQAKAFFLDQPLVDSVEAPTLPKEAEPDVRLAVNALLAAYFKAKPVYVLRADGSPQEATARWLLRTIRIEPGKVVAVLAPF